MKVLARIAFRNSVKNWRHSLAAIVSISAGFLSLVLFQGYITNVDNLYETSFVHRAMYGHVILESPALATAEGRAEPEKHLISKSEQEAIQQFLDSRKSEVVTSVRFLPATGMVTNGRNSFMFVGMGYDIENGVKMREPDWTWETLYGTPLHLAESPQAVVLGQSLGFLLGCVPVEKRTDMVQNAGYVPEVRPFTCVRNSIQLTTTTISGQLNARNFDVIGLIDGGYKDVDEKWLKLSLPHVQGLLNTDKIRFQTVLLRDEGLIQDLVSEFNQLAAQSNFVSRAVFWKNHYIADFYNKTKSLLMIFQVFIVTVILLISSLSVLNTIVKSVKERTREIGTLRSIGFTGSQIRFIFALEAVYLSLMGVLLGAAVAVMTTFVVNHSRILYRAGLLSEPVLFRIAYDGYAYLSCTILLAALAVVASQLATGSTVRAQVAVNLSHV